MFSFIIWLVVGGLIGWVAGMVMHRRDGIILNIVVGISGAVVGGWLFSPLFSAGTVNGLNFSPMGLLVSFLGAILPLAVLNLVARGSTR